VARPDRFAKQVAFLGHNPHVCVVSGAIDVVNEGDRYVRTDVFPTLPASIENELLYRNCVNHPAAMGRTAVFRSVGGYRKIVQYAEDYDLWLRISEAEQIANLPDVVLSYRTHPMTTSTRHVIAQELAVLAARGAARLRRTGKSDPLESAAEGHALDYRNLQRMLAEAVPRAEFAFSFFRTVLSRTAVTGSLSAWSRFYLRFGLWDLDARGSAWMMLLLGHVMLVRWRNGERGIALIGYPFWALVTAVRHPVVVLGIVFNLRHWLGLARGRLVFSGVGSP